MISLSVMNPRTHHFIISGDEPFRIESSLVHDIPIVHVYRGDSCNTDDDPVGVYDGTLPPQERTSWTCPNKS